MRKMASIRKIKDILPIEGADAIEVAVVDGWKVVVKKGEYIVGSLAIYCEIDSFIPTEVAPFLTKPDHFPKEYMGIKGERLRTIKLRGQISQGLLLPWYVLANNKIYIHEEGTDVSELLGIVKWEPPAEFLSSDAKGTFPSFFPKSDQERIQNYFNDVQRIGSNVQYEITEKLEGQSFSAYYNQGEFGVCSRNLELKEGDGTFWNTARKYNLKEVLEQSGKNLMIQGEQVGSGIQGNIYKLNDIRLYVYDIFLIDEQRYMTSQERLEFCQENNLLHVPILARCNLEDIVNIEGLLNLAEGTSKLYNTEREGVVFKAISDDRFSFKVISNKYLLKQK